MTTASVLLYSFAGDNAASIAAWAHDLSDAEREHFDGRGRARHQWGSLVARSLLRRELADALGCRPSEVPIARAREGKPYVATSTPWHFNLAHSGDYVALAFSRSGPIGVDLEWRARRTRIDALARHDFGHRELSDWSELPPAARRYRFFQLWTLKEAIAKARGASVWTTLTNTQWTALEPGAATVDLTGPARQAPPMAWWHFDLGADYSLGVVHLAAPRTPLQLRLLDGNGVRHTLARQPDVSGTELG